MIILIEILIFIAIGAAAYILMSKKNSDFSQTLLSAKKKEAESKENKSFSLFRALAAINKPLPESLKVGLVNRLMAARFSVPISPEEFFLIKELLIIGFIILFFPLLRELPPTSFLVPVVLGYFLPDFIVRSRIKRFQREIIKALPDTIDLLALCVGAGLDFMLAIKWVVEKSAHNLLTDELNIIMREISLGKQRKNALIDLAKRYNIEELSTFSRTLVQADRMGTSVADALNILSEDMRLARFRRGEQAAVKAPIKMLVPLLFFIFPVVWIIIGAPIIMQFMQQKTFTGM